MTLTGTPLRLFAALAAVTVSVAQQQCGTVPNGNFENGIGDRLSNAVAGRGSYAFMTPGTLPGWELSLNGVLGLQQGSAPWGRPSSGGGQYFVAIQKYCVGAYPTPCGAHGQMSTTVTGLSPGATYQVSYKVADRPGYASMPARLSVVIGTESVVDELDPSSGFTAVSHEFVANASSLRLSFVNTSPQQRSRTDSSVFIDDVTVCPTNPVTSTTFSTTSVTATTATATTHTAINDVHRSLTTLMASVDALNRRIDAIEVQQPARIQAVVDTVDALASRVDAVGIVADDAADDIATIQRVVASALRNLPIPPSNPRSCSGTQCIPKITADGNEVMIESPAGDVTISTGACGAFRPCDLLAALNDLRAIVT